jgi:hypothetical protein
MLQKPRNDPVPFIGIVESAASNAAKFRHQPSPLPIGSKTAVRFMSHASGTNRVEGR